MKAFNGEEISPELQARLDKGLKSSLVKYLMNEDVINKIVTESGISVHHHVKNLHGAWGATSKQPGGDYEILLSDQLDPLPEVFLASTFWHELYHVLRKDLLISQKLYEDSGYTFNDEGFDPKDEEGSKELALRLQAMEIVAESLIRWQMGEMHYIRCISEWAFEYDKYSWELIRKNMFDGWEESPFPPPEQIYIEIVIQVLKSNEEWRKQVLPELKTILDMLQKMKDQGENGDVDVSEMYRTQKLVSVLDKTLPMGGGGSGKGKGDPSISDFIGRAKGSVPQQGHGAGHSSLEIKVLPTYPPYGKKILEFLKERAKKIRSTNGIRKSSWAKTSKREKMDDLPPNIFIPGKRHEENPYVGFCVDTSGSMPDDVILEAFKLVESFALREKWEVRLVCGDEVVTFDGKVKPNHGETVKKAINAKLGRGGTDLNEVYNTCSGDTNVSAMIFFTDSGTTRPVNTSDTTLFVFNGRRPDWAASDRYMEINNHG